MSSSRRTDRLFIGPLPEKLLAMMHEITRPEITGNDDAFIDASYASAVRDILDRNAHAFFLRQGGTAEDWDDAARENMRDELMTRWQDYPWTRSLRHTTPRGAGASHWVGTTFEVGSILGVNVLDSHAYHAPTSAPSVATEAPQQDTGPGTHPAHASTTALSSIGPRSYWTARSHLSPPSPQGSTSTASLPERHEGDLSAFSSGSPLLATASAPSFPIDRVPKQGSDAPRSILKRPAGISSGKLKMKGRGISLLDRRDAKRKVQFPPQESTPFLDDADVRSLPLEGEEAEEGPASPSAVLARTGNEVVQCSAGATAEGTSCPDGIFLRDRMLVRVCYTKSESLATHFNEVQNRQTTNLRHEDCMEFLVVWRRDMLELYEDYTIPGKEYIKGHKHLAFLIPLASERTSVSLYSFVDLTFCILCPPTSVPDRYSRARAFLQLSKEGTNVFVFKLKSRTRARDWLWHLWHRLGGKIPPSIEIRCPDVDVRIRIDVPAPEGYLDTVYDTLSRRNIIDLIQHSLSSELGSSSVSRSWKTIIELELRAGKTLEFAWRFGGQLDWVWQERDVEGNARPWDILSGVSLCQGLRPAHLELRIAEHMPDSVHLQSGKKIFEPPAIEGFLNRTRQQGRQRVYLVTHDGNLFSLLPSDAKPPLPPSAHLSRLMSGLKPGVEEYSQTLHEDEVWRGVEQIRTAHGTLDLKSIRTVRRAYGPLSQDDGEHVARDAVDVHDVGGHQGHAQVQDRAQLLHLRRAFDIVLSSGSVLRFEAYSAQDCIEWVTRLRALVTYWSERHRVDVRDEMDAAYAASTRARPTPRIPKRTHASWHSIPSEPPMSSESPVLMSLYNWCPLSTCRSIIKAGRVFTRKGLRGQYKLVQLFLVSGRLIRYNVSPTSSLHHRNAKEIGLLDAYVASGYFAALALRPGEYSPESPNPPRRYHDGLETDEREEDELFAIWYRKGTVSVDVAGGQRPNAPVGGFQATQPIPRLSKGSHKLVMFRTRNKVERDAWCWALGCEIEKVVRNNQDRERRVREAGGLVDFSS